MANIIYDYRKLLGRMREVGTTQEELANKIGIAPTTLSLKLGNQAQFKQIEMSRICDVLNINYSDIDAYFFTLAV